MPCKQLWVRNSQEIDTSEMPECIARMTPRRHSYREGRYTSAKICIGCICEVAGTFFIIVYTTELLLKLYTGHIAYYNILDTAIVLIAFLPHLLPMGAVTCTHPEGTTKGFQTLCTLELKSSSRMRCKIAQGEDFSDQLNDIKKTLHHSDIIIMEGFCFTIPFIDLYLLFLDLQDDTRNRDNLALWLCMSLCHPRGDMESIA
ncbi:hypothetical protein AV530_008186 [Patagioenas fasciata monilis]|uniref:Uncharacterized protein n=1 Tax=Patagioenas fasciata monilis TaxID=372326 RepID=A0A1V4KV62_PATFA|nr:hypothetical protein AV530_008186 [Patagioenas fasciata monilis]